jgi:Ca2+-binding EF-hand superfamily protein
LLCPGSEDDKIHAVFENEDGFISLDMMFKFLTSMLKVVRAPNVMGVMYSMDVTVESAEDLASETALECFKTADLNQDGKLLVTEMTCSKHFALDWCQVPLHWIRAPLYRKTCQV